MSEAPERIWMDPDIRFPECEKQYGCDIGYVREDLFEELEAKLAKATGALDEIAGRQDYADDPWSIARATLAGLKGDK